MPGIYLSHASQHKNTINMFPMFQKSSIYASNSMAYFSE